ncbi:unnamed protein product [Lathyrus sativus]|nr:unnamed protein product [Lathyrus sativus]
MEVPLYETRRHTSNYPPQLQLQQNQQHQANEDSKGTLLSLLSIQGVTQLKEKWTEYNEPKRLRKLVSLFVSPTAKYVAVVAGNRIMILSKEDDYQESYAIFTGSDFGTFSVGAWSEDDEILGVADDYNTQYFIKFNGEVVAEITKKHLKISSPIVGLFSDNDSDMHESYLFTAITSDGSLQQIEISYGQGISTFPKYAFYHRSHLRNNVFCFDHHQELNLFVAVHTLSRSCHLSLWHKNSSKELEQVFSLQFEGLYSKPKGYRGQLIYPKLLILPQATFTATSGLGKRKERLLAVVNALLHRCYKYPTATIAEVPQSLKKELSGVCRDCFSVDSVNKHVDFVREYKQDFERDLDPRSTSTFLW